MKRFVLILTALALLPASVCAQERYRWFHHIQATPDDVRTVCPDASGRVWFGTPRGLFRYGDSPDGVRYDLLPEVLQLGVNEIYPFDSGRMLVRSRDGNLWVYSPVENTALDFSEILSGWGLDAPADWDLKVHTEGNGCFWFYRMDRLYRKDSGTDRVSLVAEIPGVIRSIGTKEDSFCALTDSVLYLGTVARPEERETIPHGIEFHRNGIWCTLGREGNVWVGSEGLYRFPKETLRKETVSDNLPVMDIIRSRTGGILVATGISGVWSYAPDGTLFQHATHRTFESGTIGSDNVRSIREGPDGALWVCYGKPTVSVSLPGSIASPSRHILPLLYAGLEENVSSIAQAPDGTVWFGMDGLELCKRVKTDLNTSHIPVILLTAKALAEDEIRGFELGADDYVTKPFHMQILLLRIRKLLEARQSAQRKFQDKLDVAPSEITITSLDEQFLAKAIRLTEENMADPEFSVEKLSSLLGMHRTHLYKKLLSVTGKTPLDFIRTIRLKRATQYLLQSQMYVSEIAYRVGFNSPKLFSRHFKDAFGMTPREYQRQHGVETASNEDE